MTKAELKRLKSIIADLDASAAKVHEAGSRVHLDRAISRLGDHVMRLRTLATRLERKYFPVMTQEQLDGLRDIEYHVQDRHRKSPRG